MYSMNSYLAMFPIKVAYCTVLVPDMYSMYSMNSYLAMFPIKVTLPVGWIKVTAARIERHQHVESRPNKSLKIKIS